MRVGEKMKANLEIIKLANDIVTTSNNGGGNNDCNQLPEPDEE